MLTMELLFLGLALAIDAAVVTFALGIHQVNSPKKIKVVNAISLGSIFGVFQFLMLWLGSLGGYYFSFSHYGHLFHFVVGGIFLFIAMKFLQESIEIESRELTWGLFPILLLGIVTSVDALVSGVSFGTLPKAYIPALSVGIITFIMCLVFYIFAQIFKKVPEQWLLRLSALIFIFLGARIFFKF